MRFPWTDEPPATDAPTIKEVVLKEPKQKLPPCNARFFLVYVVGNGTYEGVVDGNVKNSEYCSLLPFRGWKDGKWILGNAGKSGNISPADLKRRVCELRAYIADCIALSPQHSSSGSLVRQVFDERLDMWAKTIDKEEVCFNGDS